jgi:hypothetical protein
MLDEGVYTSVSEIGDAENISKSYVSRILRLALLAPDIVEAILAGRTDQGVMLENWSGHCRRSGKSSVACSTGYSSRRPMAFSATENQRAVGHRGSRAWAMG